MNTIDDIVDFCLEQYAPFRVWPEGRLKEWLQWHVNDSRLSCVTKAGKIAGVGLVRCLDSIDQIEDRYHHDEKGSICCVDFSAASERHALGGLWLECLMRVGMRKQAVFRRCLKSKAVRVYPFDRITHLILTRSFYGR